MTEHKQPITMFPNEINIEEDSTPPNSLVAGQSYYIYCISNIDWEQFINKNQEHLTETDIKQLRAKAIEEETCCWLTGTFVQNSDINWGRQQGILSEFTDINCIDKNCTELNKNFTKFANVTPLGNYSYTFYRH